MKNIVLIILFQISSFSLFSQQAGEIDTSFGNNGILEYTFIEEDILYETYIYDLEKLPNNKLLVIGNANPTCAGQSDNGLIMRLHPDGQMDMTFNNKGYMLFPGQYLRQLIPITETNFFLLSTGGVYKIDEDGIIDSTYGNNGFASLGIFHGSIAMGNNDTSLYLGCIDYSTGSSGFTRVLSKLNPSGFLDTNFGTNGFVTLPDEDISNIDMVDSEDNVYTTGQESMSTSNSKIQVKKFDSNGQPLTEFGDNGIFSYPVSSNGRATELHLNSDGSIFGAGYGSLGSFQDDGLILFRLLPNGTLDNTFNNNGIVTIDINGDAIPNGIHLLEDDSYIISGTGYNNMYIVKVNQNGYLETSFGNQGKVIIPSFNVSGFGTTSSISDGKIILAGNSYWVATDCLQDYYKGVLTQYFVSEALSNKEFDKSKLTYRTFPNPVKDNLTVSFSSPVQEVSYKLYDIRGQEVKRKTKFTLVNNKFLMETSNLNSGVYILSVNVNSITINKKIIKH